MDHPLQCRCGTLKGLLAHPGRNVRATCYCLDCQSYARHLGQAAQTLDAAGGTEVVATCARDLKLTAGVEQLACLSLMPQGLLRWYARCCRTPIANTPRDWRLPYAGVMHDCLGDAATRERAFGPVRMRVHTRSARTPVPAAPLGTLAGVLRLMPRLLAARASGGYRETPFFTAAGAPVQPPYVLTPQERQAARQSG